MPAAHLPDLYRAIRLAYERSEIWRAMDHFLYKEKVAERRYVLWKHLSEAKSMSSFTGWLGSLVSGLFSGYATKPLRVGIFALLLAGLFAGAYFVLGTPSAKNFTIDSLLEAIYFSATTFVTLGYGDLAYAEARPYMRILSTIEAWTGAAFIALFVVVLGRKVFR